jgi:hypothetical protein
MRPRFVLTQLQHLHEALPVTLNMISDTRFLQVTPSGPTHFLRCISLTKQTEPQSLKHDKSKPYSVEKEKNVTYTVLCPFPLEMNSTQPLVFARL